MKIKFLNTNSECEFSGQPTILEVATENDVPLSHSCGGMGSCTTCLVIIKKVSIPTNLRNELEQEHAMARGFSPFERLACQTLATDGMEILIPPPLTLNE